MIYENKKIIGVTGVFIIFFVFFQIIYSQVSAQTIQKGYQRYSGYSDLSGANSSSDSVNTITEQRKVDAYYNEWAKSLSELKGNNYSPEEYNTAEKSINEKYWPNGIPLPPGSSQSTLSTSDCPVFSANGIGDPKVRFINIGIAPPLPIIRCTKKIENQFNKDKEVEINLDNIDTGEDRVKLEDIDFDKEDGTGDLSLVSLLGEKKEKILKMKNELLQLTSSDRQLEQVIQLNKVIYKLHQDNESKLKKRSEELVASKCFDYKTCSLPLLLKIARTDLKIELYHLQQLQDIFRGSGVRVEEKDESLDEKKEIISRETDNDIYAKNLDLKPIVVDFESSLTVGQSTIKIYSPGVLPDLKPGEVLVQGKTSGKKDSYYIVDKNNLPEGYVLSGIGEINIGGSAKKDEFGFTVLKEDRFVPVYDLKTKYDALLEDTRQSNKGIFKYDFYNKQKNDHIFMKVLNSILTTVTSNDAILMHIAMNQSLENADTTLAKFRDYGKTVSAQSSSQDQIERKIYDYVNNTIKYYYAPDIIYSGHTLEQAVSCGQGVCRDKASALEYGLEAAGIQADKVITRSHVFIVVYDKQGNISHYLDPMYYESYLPLYRTNLTDDQIIKK